MSTLPTPEVPEMTEHEKLVDFAEDALRDVHSAAQSLRYHLNMIQSGVERAAKMMDEGKLPEGTHNFGPIGHQAPFDVTKKTAELSQLLSFARGFVWLGVITSEQVQEAYAKGAKGGFGA